jgi:hypothetical protein
MGQKSSKFNFRRFKQNSRIPTSKSCYDYETAASYDHDDDFNMNSKNNSEKKGLNNRGSNPKLYSILKYSLSFPVNMAEKLNDLITMDEEKTAAPDKKSIEDSGTVKLDNSSLSSGFKSDESYRSNVRLT